MTWNSAVNSPRFEPGRRRCSNHARCAAALRIAIAVLAAASLPVTANAAEEHDSDAAQGHWAFLPVVRPEIPDAPVESAAIVARTPVDAFILDRQATRTLTLSPLATRRELIRRVKFDLLGLPPTPEEIDEFLADAEPDAYDRLLDRYLASPQYGEAWGRMWLDLVRFAETAGFNADPVRPLAWKHRDYVIRAFNEDRPYDRFIAEQIAGDELYPDGEQALIATGYLRMWPDESNASNVLLARQDALNDLTSNVASVFLGLSLGCAQCHDHKFDPLLQTDFYELQAFFAGIVLEDEVHLGTHEQLDAYRLKLDAWLDETEALRTELHAIESAARAQAGYVKRLKFPAVVLEAIDTQPVERTAFQQQLVFWSERQIELEEKDVLKALTAERKQRREELRQQLAVLEKRKPHPPGRSRVMAAVEVQSQPPPTHLLLGGSYDLPDEEVQPAIIDVLSNLGPSVLEISPPHRATSGRRTALARWLADPANPLVGRVLVNRIWQGHFGRGLVENANDFGTQTPPPTHPELLDWLTAEMVQGPGSRVQGQRVDQVAVVTGFSGTGSSTLDSGSCWSIKRLHRLILTSAVYQQSTYQRAEGQAPSNAAKTDPGNRLWWHYPRRRLSAERIRDALLAVSGKAYGKMYGPGVHPPLPPDYSKREAWPVEEDALEHDRRSVYIFAKRNLPYPLLSAFDFPDMHEACGERMQTTIAPQALMLLNSDLLLEAARGLAEQVRRSAPEDNPAERVRTAWQLAFGREPDDDDTAAAVQFLNQQQTLIDNQPVAAANPHSAGDGPDPRNRRTALVDLCHVLLNANEFLFVE